MSPQIRRRMGTAHKGMPDCWTRRWGSLSTPRRGFLSDALSSVAAVQDGSPARGSTRDIASVVLQPRGEDAAEAGRAGEEAADTTTIPSDDASQATIAGAGDTSDVLNLLAGIVPQASGVGANEDDGAKQAGGRKTGANGNVIGKGREEAEIGRAHVGNPVTNAQICS